MLNRFMRHATPRVLTAALALSVCTAGPAVAGPRDEAPAQDAVAERTRIVVLDLEKGQVDEGLSTTVNAITVSAFSAAGPDMEVLSASDIRRLMDFEATRESAGCTDGGQCMAEIASAMGAELVVFGTLGQLGSSTVVTLDLFDAEAGRAIGRRTVQTRSVEDLPAALNKAAIALLAVGRRDRAGAARVVSRGPGTDAPAGTGAPGAPGSGAPGGEAPGEATQAPGPDLLWPSLTAGGAALAAGGVATAYLCSDMLSQGATSADSAKTVQAVGRVGYAAGVLFSAATITTGVLWLTMPTEETP